MNAIKAVIERHAVKNGQIIKDFKRTGKPELHIAIIHLV